MSVVVGIVGPPCSGKSTIAAALVEHGAVVIDADRLAKEQLLAPEVIERLRQWWGEGILDPDGQLSRPAIANLVFGDDEASRARLRRLESLTHPRVRAESMARLVDAARSAVPIVVLDTPLLLEVGWSLVCDEVWCVRVTPPHHAAMLARRGWTMAELERRTHHQWPIAVKETLSNRVIENVGDAAKLLAKIQTIVAGWKLVEEKRIGHCTGAGFGVQRIG